MTGPARREPLYGPGEAPAGIPAGLRREPLYRGPQVEPSQDGPARREALYPCELADPAAHREALHAIRAQYAAPAHREPLHVEPLADGHPRGVSPCTCPPLELPEHATRAGCPVHDIAARIRAELAQALAEELQRADHAALYGAGTGGPLVGILHTGPAQLAQDGARLELDELAGPDLAADAHDRHAVAILAEHGPAMVTGRPVHALQLADGRAFVLEHTAGRPQWRPTGPRPLIGTEPAHEWHCPQCGATTRARMADHPPQDGPELAQDQAARVRAALAALDTLPGPDAAQAPQGRPELAQWDRIRARQRERSTSAQHERQERPQEAAPGLAGPSAAPTGPAAGSGPQDGPQELAQELAGPSTPAQPPQDGSGHPGRPGGPQDCTRGAPCPFPLPCVGLCHLSTLRRPQRRPELAQDVDEDPRAWIPAALDAAPAFEVAGRPVHAVELADGSRYRLTPAGWQAQDVDDDDAPQLDDVDDLADAMRPGPLATLPEQLQPAQAWTGPRYAQRVELAAIVHREPLHAFVDAVERTQDDIRAAGLPVPPWPAPQERPGDREALHALQDVERVQETAHEHVRAVAQACTCTTRQREDPPCPVAADEAQERAHARVRAYLQAATPGPAVAGPFPPDASELHPAGPPHDDPPEA